MAGIRKAKRFKLKGRDFSQSRDTYNFYGSDKDAHEDRLNSPFPTFHRFPGRCLDDSERYAQLFMSEQRGYPLWSPAPNSSLPTEYVRGGVQIGDLGVITQDGMFDFLCNITLKAEDPIHTRHGVPQGFVPLECPLDIISDKRFHSNRHHLCSPKYESWKDSITVSELDMRESPRYQEAIEFTSTDRITEGAILVLPEGCSRIDLKNKQPFLDHAIENALSWFEYADSRGRTRAGKTSTLYLITGCDKAPAWGVASFVKHSDRQVTLPFYTIAEADRRTSYEWGIDKSCSARCAPEACLDSDGFVSERHINQCLFLRGYRISRGSEGEEKLHFEQDLAVMEREHEPVWDIGTHHRSDTFMSQRRGSASSSSAPPSYRPQDALNLMMSETEPKPYHPCDDINRFLCNALRMSSRVQSYSDRRPIISISHDEDWCSPDKRAESYPLVPRYTRYICENLKVTIRDNVIYTDSRNGLRLSTSLSSRQSFPPPTYPSLVSDSLSDLSSDQAQSRESSPILESTSIARNVKRETPDPTLLFTSDTASLKRPGTLDDDEGMPPPEPPPRKKRPAVRKGWKGWVEESPPPPEKLIDLDAAPVLQESRTRSGKKGKEG